MKVHKNEHINKPVKGEGKIGAKTMCALEACKALDRHGKFLVKYGPPFRKFWRLEGGIEPLRVSPPTGLKPAHRTTEDHLGGGNSHPGLYILKCDLFQFE